jgi:hypothetical protein
MGSRMTEGIFDSTGGADQEHIRLRPKELEGNPPLVGKRQMDNPIGGEYGNRVYFRTPGTPQNVNGVPFGPTIPRVEIAYGNFCIARDDQAGRSWGIKRENEFTGNLRKQSADGRPGKCGIQCGSNVS